MPFYSCYILKGLVYIAITALSSCQPSSYTKYTKLNMRSSYDIRSMSNTKYIYLERFCILRSLQLPYLTCLRVSRLIYYKET